MSKSDGSITLSYKDFLAHLKTLPPERVVGLRGSARSCPYATYLVAGKGLSSVNVGHIVSFQEKPWPAAEYTRRSAPRWLRIFMRAVDKIEPEYDRATGGVVTAAQCIAIIESVVIPAMKRGGSVLPSP